MKKIYYLSGIFVLIGFFSFGVAVKANPSFFTRYSMATATTTQAFLNPTAPSGTVATTSLTFNLPTYSNQALSTAAVLVQFIASSSSSTLAIQTEYSQDGIDWYGYGATNTPATFSDGRISWTFASSSPFGSGSGNRVNRLFTIPVMPTKYGRVQFYLMPGSQNGSVYAEVVAKQETSN